MMANHVKTDSVATIGDLLLKGWTMLAESCQDCKVVEETHIQCTCVWMERALGS